MWERESIQYSMSEQGAIMFSSLGEPDFGGTALILQENQLGWQHELLFSNLGDAPLEETAVKVCICLGMFNILIVLYTSAEM